MGYTYLEHTTDAIVSVKAKTMREAFEHAAESVSDLTFDRKTVSEQHTRSFEAKGKDIRLALLDWLESVNYVIITEGFAARRFDAKVIGGPPYTIQGIAHGEELDIAKHKFKIEVKAPTLHMMEIIESTDGVSMQFLLDL